eukprot:scaffold90081_cov79-Cyclotella_meneghiniana.AAC.2
MADEQYSYACVIDAGSSGSRVHIYQWLTSVPSSSITKYSSYESTPGINKPDSGIPALLDLLSSAQQSLPKNVDVETVPLFLGATAGMRILDPDTEASIMSEVRSLLHTSGFIFRDEWARTISGEEEGAYGWLVANYLKNGARLLESESDYTYGAIDLGGASVQVSFQPSGAILAHLFPIRVDKMGYSLYTHSYLYYGVDQANLMFHSYHIDNSTLVSPCYPVGYTDPVTGIAGSGQFHECLEQVADLFDLNYDCYHGDGSTQRCSFNGVYQPPLKNTRFILMSAFVYTWDFLGLRIGSHTDDLRKMIKSAQKICSMTYTEQLEYYNELTYKMHSDRKTNNINGQCFNAAYMYHLLHSGFGLATRQTPIEIRYNIDGTQVDWTLGMMLMERNKGSCEISGQRSAIVKVNYTNINATDYRLLFFSITPTLILISCILICLLVKTRQKYQVLELTLPSMHKAAKRKTCSV